MEPGRRDREAEFVGKQHDTVHLYSIERSNSPYEAIFMDVYNGVGENG
jgi:hypothetical protein